MISTLSLTTISHETLAALEPGDILLFHHSADESVIYEVTLSKAIVEQFRQSEPDRENGSHHIQIKGRDRGEVQIKREGGSIMLPVGRVQRSATGAV